MFRIYEFTNHSTFTNTHKILEFLFGTKDTFSLEHLSTEKMKHLKEIDSLNFWKACRILGLRGVVFSDHKLESYSCLQYTSPQFLFYGGSESEKKSKPLIQSKIEKIFQKPLQELGLSNRSDWEGIQIENLTMKLISVGANKEYVKELLNNLYQDGFYVANNIHGDGQTSFPMSDTTDTHILDKLPFYTSYPLTNISLVEQFFLKKDDIIPSSELDAITLVNPITLDATKNALLRSKKILTYISTSDGAVYVHEGTIGLHSSKIRDISNHLKIFLQNAEKKGKWFVNLEELIFYDSDFGRRLPDLRNGFKWTPALLSSILKKNEEPFVFLDFNRCLIVVRADNPLGIQNATDYILHLLKTRYDGIASLKEIQDELIQADMLDESQSIPKIWLNDVTDAKNTTIVIIDKGYVTSVTHFYSKDIYKRIEEEGEVEIFVE